MSAQKLDIPPLYLLAGGALLLALVYIKMRGIKGAAEDIGSGAVKAVVGVGAGVVKGVDDAATGAMTEISKRLGIPTPAEMITDAHACKFVMDEEGVWKASQVCSLPAFAKALTM